MLKESFSDIFLNETLHFSPQAREIKEIHPRKISYTLESGNPKKLVLFSKEKAFLIFQETEAPEELPIFQEVKTNFLA